MPVGLLHITVNIDGRGRCAGQIDRQKSLPGASFSAKKGNRSFLHSLAPVKSFMDIQEFLQLLFPKGPNIASRA